VKVGFIGLGPLGGPMIWSRRWININGRFGVENQHHRTL
jgi:3-hydroxyisobutyrate dehydrogenase-like beta-hydroxyacid dehydrogenase